MRKWLQVQYGAGPLHLLCLPAGLAFAGYLVWTIIPAPNSARILIWVAAAAVAHDLLLWPLYTIADRATRLMEKGRGRLRMAVPWINHLRVPVVLSAVMLAVSFPLVLRHSERTYHTASGLTEHPYLARWLLLTASAFAISAVIYAIRLIRVARR
ncbi:MAG TPA: hypothetical protein VG298_01955 [Acidimicrobiales bacterium]|jgi:hypothetical protein|nr:hypothetical protein [Acidimicrobiales bacterium]